MVRAHTRLINHVRGTVKSVGGHLSKCSSVTFATKALPDLPAELEPALAPFLEVIATLGADRITWRRQGYQGAERGGKAHPPTSRSSVGLKREWNGRTFGRHRSIVGTAPWLRSGLRPACRPRRAWNPAWTFKATILSTSPAPGGHRLDRRLSNAGTRRVGQMANTRQSALGY